MMQIGWMHAHVHYTYEEGLKGEGGKYTYGHIYDAVMQIGCMLLELHSTISDKNDVLVSTQLIF